jgi:hypothetical protein
MSGAMRLEEPNPDFTFKPEVDRRLRAPEPLPVKLVAVADMRVEAGAGDERQLDAFYAGLLGMQRIAGHEIVYRTESFDLYVDVLEPPVVREDYRPVRLEVKSLVEIELRLIEQQTPHVRRKGLVAGDEVLVLQDPAGNWVELTEVRLIG